MYRAFCSYLISAFLFRWIASFHWIPTKMTMNASLWFPSANFCSYAFYGQQRSLDISVNKKGSNATRKIPAGSAGRNARKGVRNRYLWIDVWAWWMLAGLARHQHRGRGVFWVLWPFLGGDYPKEISSENVLIAKEIWTKCKQDCVLRGWAGWKNLTHGIMECGMLKCISQGDEIDLALSFALLCRALGIRAKVVRCFRLESGRPYEAPRCVHNVGTCSTVVVMFCASFCKKKRIQ